MYTFVILVLLACALVTPASAQIHVDVGIHLPAPPPLVVVPEVQAVRYVSAGNANIFLYEGQYWAFTNDAWHVSHGYNGPWIVVGPQFVPRPILLVPVTYYRVPPGHWKHWNKRHAPRWGDDWGREWSRKREWKDRDDDDRDERRGKGRDKHHDKRRGRDRD